MKIEGAIIKEQGVTFGIVVIKRSAFNNPSERESIRSQISGIDTFSGIPIILMSQDSKGIPSYHGRNDIVKFLANVHPSRIPWRQYTIF